MARSIYTKLTRRNRSLSGYTQLWLAPDHILLLTSTRIAEEYKRFAIADIQSIVVTERPPRVVLQVIMILAALGWTALGFAVDSSFAKGFFAVTGALALLWPIVDIARGSRCRCYLHTRVSGELLAPVSRMKTARSFLVTVRPMIEAVQGVLEEPSTVPTTGTWEPPPPEIVASPGWVPEILFALLLVNAALIGAAIRFPKVPEIPGILLNSLGAELLLIVVALVRRKGRDTRVIIYVVAVLCILGFGFDVTTIARELTGWFMTVQEKARNNDKSPPLMSLFPPGSRTAIIAYSWRAVAGVVGLAAAFWERRRPRR
jgi:hypothetical protein